MLKFMVRLFEIEKFFIIYTLTLDCDKTLLPVKIFDDDEQKDKVIQFVPLKVGKLQEFIF